MAFTLGIVGSVVVVATGAGAGVGAGLVVVHATHFIASGLLLIIHVGHSQLPAFGLKRLLNGTCLLLLGGISTDKQLPCFCSVLLFGGFEPSASNTLPCLNSDAGVKLGKDLTGDIDGFLFRPDDTGLLKVKVGASDDGVVPVDVTFAGILNLNLALKKEDISFMVYYDIQSWNFRRKLLV